MSRCRSMAWLMEKPREMDGKCCHRRRRGCCFRKRRCCCEEKREVECRCECRCEPDVPEE